MSETMDDHVRFARNASARSVLARPLEASLALRALDRLAHVPGLTKCDRCGFSLVSSNLHADTGQVSAREEPSICPNDGAPMRRVTERETGNELLDRWDREMPIWQDAGKVTVERIEGLMAEHGSRNVRILAEGEVMFRALGEASKP